MSTQPHETGFDLRPAPPPVHWRAWPIAARRSYAVGVAAVLCVVMILVRWQAGSTGWAIAAAALMALSLWRSLLPVHFELNANGLTEHSLGRNRRIPWTAMQHYEVLAGGLVISPVSHPTPLDRLRSLYVPWGEQREEVLALFAYHLGPPGDK